MFKIRNLEMLFLLFRSVKKLVLTELKCFGF